MINKISFSKRFILFCLDWIILNISFLLPNVFKSDLSFPFSYYFFSFFILNIIAFSIFFYESFYSRFENIPNSEIVYTVLKSTFIITLIIDFIATFNFNFLIFNKIDIIYSFFIFTALVLFEKLYIAPIIIAFYLRKGIDVCRIAIIGNTEKTGYIVDYIKSLDKNKFILQGVIGKKNGFYDDHIIGTLENFNKIINKYNINTGIITLDKNKEEDILKLITKCRNNNISIYLISDFFDIVDSRNTTSLSGLPIINLTSDSGKNIYLAIKRIFDILISLFCIIMLSPLMIFVSYLIKLNSKGPVIFKQERVGKDGKPFVMYKFRSMYSDSRHITHKQYIEKFILEQNDDSVYKINGDPRITKIGRILRETSLDELPQLFNVLKGNMSIIGPRPAIGYEVSIYRDWHKKRLRVKPGITGFWQINGRSRVKFDDMVILDIYYIENWSLLLDFIILLKTIPVVIQKEGAY